MTDNSQINTGSGDAIRDIDRSLNPVPIAAKTQIVQLDAGGQNAESLVSGNNPMPVIDPFARLRTLMVYQQLLVVQGGTSGFVPIETPGFLIGL